MLSSSLRFSLCPRFFSSAAAAAAATVTDSSFHLLQPLQSSIDNKCLSLSQQCHAQILSLGFDQDSFLTTKLISAYSICGAPTQSRLVFDSIHHKTIFLWNSLISGYVKNRLYEGAFNLFKQMCRTEEEVTPDNFTFSTLLKSAAELGDLKFGEMIHCRIIRTGFVSDTVLSNSLMLVYSKCGSFCSTRKVFDEMPERNSASWNVLISVNASMEDFSYSLDIRKLVKQMQSEGVKLDAFTFSSILPLCGINYVREIHCFVMKNELNVGSDIHIGCCLIHMYSKSKNLTMGRRVFDLMNCRNIVAWTAMITGYIQNGDSEEAMNLFREMQASERIEPNRVSLISILPGFSSFAGLREGKQIHGFAIRNEFTREVSLSNALVDMYSKCGSLSYARHVFDSDIYDKDAISWSSMISGYGLHGNGGEAISLFNNMLQLGIKPDNITLVGVLSACCRSGLETEGLNIYDSVVADYGISPTVEICACVVDMLGRAGQLDQALEFINSMPMKPGPSVWGALFGACVVHENTDIRDLASKHLTELEPENPSNYVSMSNALASVGRWDVVAELRRKMKDRGLKKLPGCSWICVNGEMHSFYVADKMHPCSIRIYEMLDDLMSVMKGSRNGSLGLNTFSIDM